MASPADAVGKRLLNITVVTKAATKLMGDRMKSRMERNFFMSKKILSKIFFALTL